MLRLYISQFFDFYSLVLFYRILFLLISSFKVLHLEVSGIPLISSLFAFVSCSIQCVSIYALWRCALRFVSPLVSRRIFSCQFYSLVDLIICELHSLWLNLFMQLFVSEVCFSSLCFRFYPSLSFPKPIHLFLSETMLLIFSPLVLPLVLMS